jgi:hypothetical protein
MTEVKDYKFNSNPAVLCQQLEAEAQKQFGNSSQVDGYFWGKIYSMIEQLASQENLTKVDVILMAMKMDNAFIKYLTDGGFTEEHLKILTTGQIATTRLHQIYTTLLKVGA